MKKVHIIVILVLASLSCFSQKNKTISFEKIGEITPRHAREIQSSNISIGAEMMDRDFTIYANWKDYLGPLGAKKARIQSGWAKCENEKGVYNWAWLDAIIFDMVDQGVEPWVNLSYGNPVYSGGGGTTLKQKHLPSTEEALQAWEQYVGAIVNRYKNVVDEWEIWNEPNYGISNKKFAEFVVRTARAVKSEQPDAKVIGIALGSGVDYEYADQVLVEIEKLDGISLLDEIAHHRHIVAPEENVPEIELERVVDKYSKKILTRQGEAGCPSEMDTTFALNNMEWSEIQQSKHILRRLMCDLGRGKETSIFTIIDSKYIRNGEVVWNHKGLLASTEDQKVSHKKEAYKAMQHVTSIFDFSLQPIQSFAWEAGNDDNLYVFAHENIYSHQQVVACWFGNQKPTESVNTKKLNLKFYNGNFKTPVYVDLRTGEVFEIPDNQWSKSGTVYEFNNIPVYDSPVLIAEKSLLKIKESH